jgi:uncharacterized protein YktB (UPF0637 family)
MSRMIDRLINELVADDMITVKKMKKTELLELAEVLMKDNMREMHDDTIVAMYEEQFNTHLARS